MELQRISSLNSCGFQISKFGSTVNFIKVIFCLFCLVFCNGRRCFFENTEEVNLAVKFTLLPNAHLKFVLKCFKRSRVASQNLNLSSVTIYKSIQTNPLFLPVLLVHSVG